MQIRATIKPVYEVIIYKESNINAQYPSILEPQKIVPKITLESLVLAYLIDEDWLYSTPCLPLTPSMYRNLRMFTEFLSC